MVVIISRIFIEESYIMLYWSHDDSKIIDHDLVKQMWIDVLIVMVLYELMSELQQAAYKQYLKWPTQYWLKSHVTWMYGRETMHDDYKPLTTLSVILTISV